MRLDHDQLEQLADLIAERLREGEAPTTPAGLVDAWELATQLGVNRSFVYQHWRELGGVRLGGPRGRLRFDPAQARAALAAKAESPAAVPHPRRRRSSTVGSVLKSRPRSWANGDASERVLDNERTSA